MKGGGGELQKRVNPHKLPFYNVQDYSINKEIHDLILKWFCFLLLILTFKTSVQVVKSHIILDF